MGDASSSLGESEELENFGWRSVGELTRIREALRNAARVSSVKHRKHRAGDYICGH